MTAREKTVADALPTRPHARILRAAEARAWQDGYGFLDAARREAEEMRLSAREAYANEYAQGYQEGRMAGEEEAARLVSDTVAKVDRYLGSIEKDVVGMALDVVRRMLGDMDVAALVAKAARQAVADVRRAKYLKITVHPAAADEVRTALQAMLEDSGLGLTIEILTDSTLAEGGCIVASDVAVIDASIDAQLAAIGAAIAAREVKA